MDILVLSPTQFDGVGGIETVLRDLIKQWEMEGHRVTFVGSDTFTEGKMRQHLHIWKYARAHDVTFIVASTFRGLAPALWPRVRTVLVHHDAYLTRNRDDLDFRTSIKQHARRFWARIAGGIAASEWIAHSLPGKQYVAMNPLSAPTQAPGSQIKDIDVIFIGRLVPEKNAGMVLRSIGAAIDKNISVKSVFIVGGGPESKALGLLVAALNLSQVVTLTGPLRHEEAMRYLARAKVMIMPSLREPFGMVAAEALAREVRIIVSDRDNLPLTYARYGHVVDPHDHETCARLIGELLLDSAPSVSPQALLRRMDPRSSAQKYLEIANSRPVRGKPLFAKSELETADRPESK